MAEAFSESLQKNWRTALQLAVTEYATQVIIMKTGKRRGMSPPHLIRILCIILFISMLLFPFFCSKDDKLTDVLIFYTHKFKFIPASQLFGLQADGTLKTQLRFRHFDQESKSGAGKLVSANSHIKTIQCSEDKKRRRTTMGFFELLMAVETITAEASDGDYS